MKFLCGKRRDLNLLRSALLLAGTIPGLIFAASPSAASGAEEAVEGSVQEIAPGILQGYLHRRDYPDSLSLLPPPPEPGSSAHRFDEAASREYAALTGTPRWQLATVDAGLKFPEALGTFSCAVDAPLTEEDTPRVNVLLRRSLTDAGLATYAAKNHYQRKRPFLVNGEPVCTPEDEDALAGDGSYPSGHTALGWAWALILSEIVPDHADAILARGLVFGQSRMVCNVHWRSDVAAGRLMGAAVVARLHADEAFRSDLAAARAEIDALRDKGLRPTRDCAAEAKAMKLTSTGTRYPVVP